MHCTFEQALKENADLKQKLNCFWEIENVNPFDECVISQFEEDSDFNGERQVTRQVFKDYGSKKKLLKEYQNEICKTPGEVHYLPHRPVIHEERDTTKIRAVFDASYSTNGPSVNECLYSGPYFLTKIFDILIKFRFNSIAILTDIKQFFLNVAISKEHMNYLCFFWYDDVTSENEAKLIIHRFL